MSTLSAINLYPVKGLGATPLERAQLELGGGLLHDRRYGMCFGDPATLEANLVESWKPWNQCYTLKIEKGSVLAKLRVSYDPADEELGLSHSDKKVQANPATAAGRKSLEEYIADTIGLQVSLADSIHLPLWDWGLQAPVTILNLATVADLSTKINYTVDPLRFRANLLIAGLEPWVENEWEPGQQIQVGNVTLELVRQITRCAATKVNPVTAEIDRNIPGDLVKNYGHNVCGIGLKVISAGTIANGDKLSVI